LNVNEYIASGVIETCILGIAEADDIALFEKMRVENNDVHQYALAFELALENKLKQESTHLPEMEMARKNFFSSISNSSVTEPNVHSITKESKKSVFSQYAAAASIALLLGSLITNFTLFTNLKKQQSEIATLKNNASGSSEFNFLKNPEIVPIAMNGVGIHAICRCSLYWDKAKKQVYFQIHHLMQPANDKAYQLWALVNGKTINVGTINYNKNKQPFLISNIPDNVTEFAVTLENASGATVPNNDTFLKGVV
jgi:hypothetical protein